MFFSIPLSQVNVSQNSPEMWKSHPVKLGLLDSQCLLWRTLWKFCLFLNCRSGKSDLSSISSSFLRAPQPRGHCLPANPSLFFDPLPTTVWNRQVLKAGQSLLFLTGSCKHRANYDIFWRSVSPSWGVGWGINKRLNARMKNKDGKINITQEP